MAQYVARGRTLTAIRLTKDLMAAEGEWLVIEGEKVRNMDDDTFLFAFADMIELPAEAAHPAPPPPPMPVPPPPPPMPPQPVAQAPVQAAPEPQSTLPGLSDQPDIAPPRKERVVIPADKKVPAGKPEKRTRSTDIEHLAPRPPASREASNDPRERIMKTQCGRFFYYLRRIGGKGLVTTIQDAIYHDCDRSPKSLSAGLSVMKNHGLVSAMRASEKGLSFVWQVTKEGLELADKCGVACFTDYGLRVPPERVEENVTPITAKHQILHGFEELSRAIGTSATARH